MCSLLFFTFYFINSYHTSQQKIQIFDIMVFMYCSHVYEESESDICEKCGGDTHKIDWDFQKKMVRWWPTSGNAKSEGWWSI